mmetsp:Transcript_58029/g.96230  ORF Transcript_58029/g.96230 Transcript_58029/m.96230 type:complete len:116 (-) Transcript_58029:1403-1750(-)
MGNQSTNGDGNSNTSSDHHASNAKQKNEQPTTTTTTTTSTFGSLLNGIKGYFGGTQKSEIEELDNAETRFTNKPVFMQLSAPNYHFANQGLQWVEETMYYDEEGDGYHISVGPLS